jgi:hypothetical protein
VFLFYYGFRHSSKYADRSELSCDKAMCKLYSQNNTGSSFFEFARGDLKAAEVVRHDGTGIIDVSTLKRKAANKVGYTIQLKVNYSPESGSRLKVPRFYTLYDGNMGRSSARSGSKTIGKYIDNEQHTVTVSGGSGWTSLGIVSVIVGIISFVLSLIIGQFSDPEPRRLRKAR